MNIASSYGSLDGSTCLSQTAFCANTLPVSFIARQQSAISFLPCAAMRKRGLSSRPVTVRLSVRLSLYHVRVLYPDG